MEFFVDAGYTVVAIDYRLAPEFKLADIVRDVQDAYIWIREQGPDLYGIDPSRIAIVGHSAGGYLALNAGAHLDPKPSALVSFYGYGDLSGDWVTQPGVYYTDRPQITKEQASEFIGDVNGCLPKESEMDPRFDYYVYTRQNGIWAMEVAGRDPLADAHQVVEGDREHDRRVLDHQDELVRPRGQHESERLR